MSLRTRLGLLVAASVAIAVLAVSAASLWVARQEARSALDAQLRERASTLLTTGGRLPERVGARAFGRFIPRDVLVQIVNPRGRVLYVSDDVLPVNAGDMLVAADETNTFWSDVEAGDVHLRMLTVSLPRAGALMVARPLSEVEENLEGLRNTLALVAAVGVAGAGLLGFVVAGRAIRPVRRLTAAARTVAQTQDLDHPIEPERDDELGELARSFNAMLEALALSRAQQQRLVTDAGHELRTPLTSIRTNIELLVRADQTADASAAAAAAADTETGSSRPVLDVAERRRMLDDVVFELDQLTVLVAELVELAADQRSLGEPELADLSEIAEAVVERHRRRSGFEFVTSFEPCTALMNVALVERAISNLIDNAVKWSPPGEPIDVTVAPDRSDATASVRDRGPGIDRDLRQLVFERFFRAPEARALPGSGLGLSIVDYVAHTHGGSATVVDTEGPGAWVELRLPLSEAVE